MRLGDHCENSEEEHAKPCEHQIDNGQIFSISNKVSFLTYEPS